MTTPWSLATVDEVVPLVGHSGASILLISKGSERRVRKTARGAAESPRLLRQMKLQQAAHEAGLGAPMIISSGADGDRAFFEMEYVPGRSLAKAIMEGDPPDLRELERFLLNVIGHSRRGEGRALRDSIFSEKLNNISDACSSMLSSLGLVEEFSRMRSIILDGPIHIPDSPAHGDLTFDNILIDNSGRFILIDFDDPGFSSWKLDLGKMMQDVWGRWCLRHVLLEAPGSVAAVNALVELDQIREGLAEVIFKTFPTTQKELARICLFHLARILPYCRNDDVSRFVMASARRVIAEHVTSC